METTGHPAKGYLLAATLGAIGGGLAVLLAARAMYKMMSGRMSGMMRGLMSDMGAEACDPAEM